MEVIVTKYDPADYAPEHGVICSWTKKRVVKKSPEDEARTLQMMWRVEAARQELNDKRRSMVAPVNNTEPESVL